VHRPVHQRESSEGQRGVKGPAKMSGEPTSVRAVLLFAKVCA
jgi:hypothetical protein